MKYSSSCLSSTMLLLFLLLHYPSLHVNSLLEQQPSLSSQKKAPPPLRTLPIAVNKDNQQQQQQHKNILQYTSYWDKLLLQEHAELEMDLAQRRKTWSRSDLVSSGLSILNAMAEPDSELYGEKIVRISIDTTNHFGSNGISSTLRDKFTRGDVLVMTKGTDIVPRECLVVDVGKDWLTAGVGSTWPKGLYESRKLPFSYRVRLDRTVPRAPLKAQRHALAQLSKLKAGAAATLLATTFLAGGAGAQQDTTRRRPAAQELTSQAPPWLASATTEEERNAVIALAMKKALLLNNTTATTTATATTTTSTSLFQPNDSQAEAIQWALQRRMSLIRGPPGTGKTQCAATLVATFLQLATILKQQQQQLQQQLQQQQSGAEDSNCSHHRVLAVTHSNGAADVLLEALLKLNVPAVRLGRPALVSPRVQHRTVVAISQRLPEVVKFRRQQQQQQQRQQIAQHDQQGSRPAEAELDVKRYMMDAQKMILETAPVVVTSCIGAHQLMLAANDDDNNQYGWMKFSLVVLDEAAQTTEPALVCALAAARAEQVIFVGDTQQLPPTVTSSRPELRDSLGLSPMARLERLDIGQVTLQTQYRMPAALLEHPSRYFYGGLVQCVNDNSKNGEENPSAVPPTGFPWPNGQPLAFVQVTTGANDCEIAHSFGGRSNPTEVDLVVRIIKDLLLGGEIAGDDISVISPYSKQVQLIRTALATTTTRNGAQDIRVGTVDSFQGQETGVVIFSAVRSNPLHELGFLRDRRRLCVAITRARRGLILVGDATVLKSCRHWAALLASCEERGLSMSDRDLMEQKKRKQMIIKQDYSILSKTAMSVEDALDDLLGGTDDKFGLFV